MEEPTFRIIRGQGENLSLTYLGSQYENSADFRIDATLSPFRCSFNVDARVDEIVDFAEQLRQLHRSLVGAAGFNNLERQVKAMATIDKLGHITWKVELCPSYFRPTLLAEVVEDQSMLPPLLEELDAVIAALRHDGALVERGKN